MTDATSSRTAGGDEGEVVAFSRREPPALAEANRLALRRQAQFRRAAEVVAEAFGRLPAVRRVTLFGSVVVPLVRERSPHRSLRRFGTNVLHECKDVDLAVHLDDLSDLRSFQKARARALADLTSREGIGVAHHQVDVFVLEPGTDRYLGRLCHYRDCPAAKPECRVPGCGESRRLRLHQGFVLDPRALAPERCVVLHDADNV